MKNAFIPALAQNTPVRIRHACISVVLHRNIHAHPYLYLSCERILFMDLKRVICIDRISPLSLLFRFPFIISHIHIGAIGLSQCIPQCIVWRPFDGLYMHMKPYWIIGILVDRRMNKPLPCLGFWNEIFLVSLCVGGWLNSCMVKVICVRTCAQLAIW